jgi:transcriptional regulator with XRE-family HTH domain
MSNANDQSDITHLAELGKRLTAQRIDRRLTQAMLASAAGVSKRTVERLETGHSVQLIYLLRILRELGLRDGLSQLFTRPADPTKPAPKRVRFRAAQVSDDAAVHLSPPLA